MDKAKISRRAFAGMALAACTGLVTPMAKAPRGRRVDALLARMSVADKIAQLNIPVCLPQELLGDSTDPTGTREHREAYVRGETVVGERADRITLGPGGGFFGLVNQSLSGSVPVPHPLSPRQQALQHNHLQRLARANPLGIPLLQISEGTHGSVGPGRPSFPRGWRWAPPSIPD